jgi:tetratricopeptide (TPR) repeat protein
MRRVSGFVPFFAFSLLSSRLLSAVPSAAQQRTPPSSPSIPDTHSSQAQSLSVNGRVTDAATHRQLDSVRVELRSFSGAVVGTAFTDGSGSFQFNNIAGGNYTLAADGLGYQTATLPVEVYDFSVYGIQVELQRPPDASTPVNKGPNTVSLRELSIPRKAHEDMEKGTALLYGRSDYRGCIKLFEKAIQEFPEYYEAYAQIGIAYMKLADADNSEKAFRKSIELSHESYSGAYFGLGELFLNEGRFADAEPLSRKAVEINSNSWQANSQLARALLGLHRSADAEKSALAAVALKPDNENLYLVLANVHNQLQNEPALLEDLNHYLRLAPTGPFAEQARGERDRVQHDLAASLTSPAASSTSQPQAPDPADR